ncbi:MAG: hypothetical protein AAGF44_11850 [Pseudomonadota bacterium]
MPRFLILALAIPLGLAACARGTVETARPHPFEISTAETGQILALRPVDLSGSETLADDGAGARFGGYAGLVIGSFIGQGSGRALGALIGLGTGALLGAVIENEVERDGVTEYLIRLTDGPRAGEEIVILTDRPGPEPGETVRVIDRSPNYSLLLPAPA